MKKTLENAMEIENSGGAVMASNWTTGSGRHITKRSVPVYCQELRVWEALRNCKGKTLRTVKRTVKRIEKQHPRCEKVICVTDRRSLNCAVKG